MILLSWILLEALAKGMTIFLNNQKMFMEYFPDFMECRRVLFLSTWERELLTKG